jgi:alkanesulfonate monooxygenase SsuD/methylene tetrahydromethanopterin reductase-like flavin-dependent oxidoreductase (luciferase family)
MSAAAERAGRPAPRIVASVPVCVTDEPGRVRGVIASVLANYNELPSYRGVMDLEGANGPEDVSIVGDEDHVRAELDRFADAGTTDFSALEFVTNREDYERTRSLLRDLA